MNPDFIEFPNARERVSETAALPGLWGRFAAAGAGEESGAPGAVFSVYTEYESDVHGEYTVVLGREGVPSSSAERSVRVPAGRYAVFTSAGEMPAAVLAGWQQVWAYFARPGAPARAYTTDFEYYDSAEPSTVRIYAAVHDGEAGSVWARPGLTDTG